MASTVALLVLTALGVIGAAGALSRRDSSVVAPVATDEDLVVDLEFLRARPAELEQRISELVAMSGRRTLGARMHSAQRVREARPPSTSAVVRTRRRTQPLVASR